MKELFIKFIPPKILLFQNPVRTFRKLFVQVRNQFKIFLNLLLTRDLFLFLEGERESTNK